jgi:polyisoprenoid-binding protein YceI
MKAPMTIKRGRPAQFGGSFSAIILSLFILHPAVDGFAEEYHVDREETNTVKFISDAPFEDFEGVTDKIDGYVLWNGTKLSPDSDYSNREFYFEVELASLDTGIGLRNRHMRENYLETDTYPYVSFKGKLTSVAVDSADDYSITGAGIFSLHGFDREISIIANVFNDENGIKVQSEFDIKLSDYNIEIPSLMFLKINETIHLILDFHLKKVIN